MIQEADLQQSARSLSNQRALTTFLCFGFRIPTGGLNRQSLRPAHCTPRPSFPTDGPGLYSTSGGWKHQQCAPCHFSSPGGAVSIHEHLVDTMFPAGIVKAWFVLGPGQTSLAALDHHTAESEKSRNGFPYPRIQEFSIRVRCCTYTHAVSTCFRRVATRLRGLHAAPPRKFAAQPPCTVERQFSASPASAASRSSLPRPSHLRRLFEVDFLG